MFTLTDAHHDDDNSPFITKSTFRIFTRDDSFIKTDVLKFPSWVEKFQVVLMFARDTYSSSTSQPNGNFTADWDTNKVTPTIISSFREAVHPYPVEFLVGIGDVEERYSFATTAEQRDLWLNNALTSLKKIIDDYKLDGIDICHHNIKEGADYETIGFLIQFLKQMGITAASISPTSRLNNHFYLPLCKKFYKYIDNVVYQTHTETQPIDEENFGSLFENLVELYSKEKLMASFSYSPHDWGTVPLFVFDAGAANLLSMKNILETVVVAPTYNESFTEAFLGQHIPDPGFIIDEDDED